MFDSATEKPVPSGRIAHAASLARRLLNVSALVASIQRAIDAAPTEIRSVAEIERKHGGQLPCPLPCWLDDRGDKEDAADGIATVGDWLFQFVRPVLREIVSAGNAGLILSGLQQAKAFPETPGQAAARAALAEALRRGADLREDEPWSLLCDCDQADRQAAEAKAEFLRASPAHPLWHLLRQKWLMGDLAGKAPQWPGVAKLSKADRTDFELTVRLRGGYTESAAWKGFAATRDWFAESLRWLRDEIQQFAPTVESAQAETTGRIKGEARALALLVQHPDWSESEIAEAVPCARQTLYKWPKYAASRAAMKHGKSELPKGSKTRAHDVEAWEESE